MARVLVIDDDEGTRDVIAEILRDESHDVSVSVNGQDGLSRAAALRPDIILCDIVMPGMNGYEVLSALRRDPVTATTPVIFLTGVHEPEAVRAGMNLGADDYLAKPATSADLVATVAARLKRSEVIRHEADRRLQELKDELARSLLPHEFLTPLTAVMGLASHLIEEDAIPPSDVKDVARGILQGGRALEELIRRFLDFAELQALVPGTTEGLEPDRAFETLRSEATERASRAGRAADLEIAGGPVRAPVPLDHWRLLVRELIDNALKFSNPGSTITVALMIDGGAPTLTVRDRGRGMTAEALEGLGRRAPFLRRHQDQPGLGLGLNLVRRVLQLYGGTLTFETAAGQGTTVRARFLSR